MTENRDLARAFSHQLTLLGHSESGVRHNGSARGYLYVVAEPLASDDLTPHPHPANADRWEWLVTRTVCVRLLERTEPRADELYTDAEVALLRANQRELGVRTFVWDVPLY